MKSRNALIAVGIAAALAAAVGVYNFTASAQGGPDYGWGMMGSYGPGNHMRSWGGGPSPGSWNCPVFGQNDE